MGVSTVKLNGDTLMTVNDTTATASDVAQSKYFYAADGTKTAGTASGGGGDDGSLKGIIEKTATNPTLPNDLTMISDYIFYNYPTLALTSLPSGVTSIGVYAFYECTNLALTSLPSGVTSIGQYAFYNCTNLALTGSLPSGITSVGASAFYKCTNLALTSLPSSVTSIGGSAFRGCQNITEMSCDGVITSFAASAFLGLTSVSMRLSSVSFPNLTIASLASNFGSTTAAMSCQLLAFADIGSTKSISANTFANCKALQTLILRRSDAICTLANTNAFTNTPMDGYNSLTGTVYVPNALISTYQTATNWSTLYNNGTVSFQKIEGSQYEL